jgi:hypothetical protein
MKRLPILIIIISVFLYSCGSGTVDLAIDNPTEFDVQVTIDTLKVHVPAREVVWVEMGKGPHQITLANDSAVQFDFTQEMYMLNPTFTEYLKYEQFYGDEMYRGISAATIMKKKVTYLGMELEGNYEVIKDLVNPITWDYGPREALPEMIEMDEDEKYTSIVKITDPIELINEIAASEGN